MTFKIKTALYRDSLLLYWWKVNVSGSRTADNLVFVYTHISYVYVGLMIFFLSISRYGSCWQTW